QEKLIFAQKAVGLNPSPFDSWLVSRGIKTMALRMQKHQENSLRIANYLEDHNCFKNVRYPFLPTHPQYELAKRQMTGGSGIITTELNLSFENTIRFLKKLSLFTLAESLGGVESLICHPASMTHAAIPKEMRLKIGITDTLIRFSVGIENIEDLINDIEQAL
nr:PLP-dependent transferase [Pseudomonadota bacterium]